MIPTSILFLCLQAGLISGYPDDATHHPSIDAAKNNAFHIFNSIHSAMRQWGSALKHNGMSFYLATVPQGNLFYHGSHDPNRVEGFEWIAFEVEHAVNFGQSFEPPDTKALTSDSIAASEILARHRFSHRETNTLLEPATSDQKPLGSHAHDDRKKPQLRIPRTPMRGYLHTYRAARDLTLLYIDGESAAKCELGTTDSTDYLLLDYSPEHPPDIWRGEYSRAFDLCKLAESWAWEWGRIDGFVRVEAGFEIIYCDLADGGGMDLESVHASPWSNQTGERQAQSRVLEWVRAASQRYDGLPGGRITIDYSSMVSAFAYPVNLTNPDEERQDLPRIVNTPREERIGIRARLRDVVAARHDKIATGINWQGVVDMIVSRYSDRVLYLARGNLTAGEMLSEVGTALDPFMDFSAETPAAASARDRCTEHYLDASILDPASFTPEDTVIHAAVETVSSAICTALFDVRQILFNSTQDGRHPSGKGPDASEQAAELLEDLMRRLDWTTWRRCGKCADLGEVCFTVLFPLGSSDDFWTPRCKKMSEMLTSSYWDPRPQPRLLSQEDRSGSRDL